VEKEKVTDETYLSDVENRIKRDFVVTAHFKRIKK
jgi:hypothetical protein